MCHLFIRKQMNINLKHWWAFFQPITSTDGLFSWWALHDGLFSWWAFFRDSCNTDFSKMVSPKSTTDNILFSRQFMGDKKKKTPHKNLCGKYPQETEKNPHISLMGKNPQKHFCEGFFMDSNSYKQDEQIFWRPGSKTVQVLWLRKNWGKVFYVRVLVQERSSVPTHVRHPR